VLPDGAGLLKCRTAGGVFDSGAAPDRLDFALPGSKFLSPPLLLRSDLVTDTTMDSVSPGGDMATVGPTVLLAEDEPGVRGPVRRMLVAHGFTVIEAVDGEEALAVAAAHHGRIDLLLTDVVMPGIGGAELARRLREARPEVRILFMTGYSVEAVASHGVLAPGTTLLQKPFTVEELVGRVREALDAPP
jgi:two-component system, cell cycle sensor histidine kinase and response regulator CckA